LEKESDMKILSNILILDGVRFETLTSDSSSDKFHFNIGNYLYSKIDVIIVKDDNVGLVLYKDTSGWAEEHYQKYGLKLPAAIAEKDLMEIKNRLMK
jgi:hypothetical protein